mmetsp:Transcript_38924/g.91404  ORF Transcript_38924/g.91404 Transcript_38924/m.91404 type:complete len:280 (-) Transcript_38924:3-842(-)
MMSSGVLTSPSVRSKWVYMRRSSLHQPADGTSVAERVAGEAKLEVLVRVFWLVQDGQRGCNRRDAAERTDNDRRRNRLGRDDDVRHGKHAAAQERGRGTLKHERGDGASEALPVKEEREKRVARLEYRTQLERVVDRVVHVQEMSPLTTDALRLAEARHVHAVDDDLRVHVTLQYRSSVGILVARKAVAHMRVKPVKKQHGAERCDPGRRRERMRANQQSLRVAERRLAVLHLVGRRDEHRLHRPLERVDERELAMCLHHRVVRVENARTWTVQQVTRR